MLPVRSRLRAARMVVVASAAAGSPSAAERRTFVDCAGREVRVPRELRRVDAAGGPASIIIHTLAPEKLAGWSRERRELRRLFDHVELGPVQRDERLRDAMAGAKR